MNTILTVHHDEWVLAKHVLTADPVHSDFTYHRPPDNTRARGTPTLSSVLGTDTCMRLLRDHRACAALYSLATHSANAILATIDLHHAVQQCRNLVTAPRVCCQTHVNLADVMLLNLRLLGATVTPDFGTVTTYDTAISDRLRVLRRSADCGHDCAPALRTRVDILQSIIVTHGLLLQLIFGTTTGVPVTTKSQLLRTRWTATHMLSAYTHRAWFQRYRPVMPGPDTPRPPNTFDATLPAGYLYVICGLKTSLTYVG